MHHRRTGLAATQTDEDSNQTATRSTLAAATSGLIVAHRCFRYTTGHDEGTFRLREGRMLIVLLWCRFMAERLTEAGWCGYQPWANH